MNQRRFERSSNDLTVYLQAETELEAVSKDIETGKLYFTGDILQ